MTPEDEREAHRIFRLSLDEPTTLRPAFVRRACDGRPEVLAKVEALLGSLGPAEAFLESPALASMPRTAAPGVEPETSLVGTQVGRYRVLERIAAGGMGVVFLAEQDNPRRRVALKVMRAGLGWGKARRLFEHESHVLGRLQHPNIAQIFEASTHAHGPTGEALPYFAMEYLEGAEPITAHAHRRRLDRADRIALFRKACLGVHHGHQKGVIHRDLKPANIIVDAAGEPRVIDYGVALVAGGDVPGSLAQTDRGVLVGTLKYMSPEQCRGDAQRIDTRCDVYALGVVLYELLCERFPYDVDEAAPLEVPRIVTDRSPVRPSVAVPDFPRDLETILLKALAKDPDDRYQSAADLERDLGRFLRHEPIEARPPTMRYHTRLFVRRHRTLIGAVVFAALAGCAALVVSVGYGISASREAERRSLAEGKAIEERDEAVRLQYFADMAAAESALRAHEYGRLRSHLARAPTVHRGWEWDHLRERSEPSRVVVEQPTMIDAVAVAPDGSAFLAAGRDGTVRIWSVAEGTWRGKFKVESKAIFDLRFSPDGSQVAVAGANGLIELFAYPSLQRTWRSSERHSDAARALCFSPDGAVLVSAGQDGSVRGWSAADGGSLWVTDAGGPARAVAHHPHDPIVATEGGDGTIRFWDTRHGEAVGSLSGHPGDQVFALAYSPDGHRLYSGSSDRTVAIWNLDTGERERTLPGHDRSIWSLAVTADGTRVASASIDQTVRLWDADGASIGLYHGHGDAVADIAFTPDGARFVTGSWDRTVRVWDSSRTSEPLALHDGLGPVDAVEVGGDGRLVATAHRDGPVLLRDAVTLEVLRTIGRSGAVARSLAFSPDGRTLAVGWSDGLLALDDTCTGRRIWEMAVHRGSVSSVRFTPDGQHIVSGGRDERAIVWNARDGTVVRRCEGLGAAVGAVAVAPDSRRFATTGWDGVVRLWAIEGDGVLAEMAGHESAVYAAVFDPEGGTLFTGSRDQTIRRWNGWSGQPLSVLEGHGQFVTGLAFMPDGSRLVSTSWFETLTVWDAATLEPLVTLRGHDRPVRCVAVDPAGDRILTGAEDGSLRIWDRRSREAQGQARTRIEAQAEPAEHLAGTLMAAGDPSAAVAAIDRDLGIDPALRHAVLNAILRRTATPAAAD
ncbi:MAG: protein kinase [Phycisphaerales bacterium]|nr:protein kinase [Phycisphaerales bacterium]